MLLLGACSTPPEPALDTRGDSAEHRTLEAAAPTPPDGSFEAIDPPAAATGPHPCPGTITLPADPRGTALPPAADPHAPVFGEAPDPFHVRVQWHADPSNSVAVVWRTDAETLASTVEIGDATIPGASFLLSPDPGDGRVHEVRVCGLAPGTTYAWRAGGDAHWSPDRVVTTAPVRGSEGTVVFGVAGDARDGPATWTQVLSGMASHGVAFRLFTGDAVARGEVVGEWAAWLDAGAGYEDVAPTMMAHGNHENLALPYFALNALPGDELTYSFDYGNVHFVAVNDSVASGEDWATQAAWLDADLAATPQPWRVVYHHKPAYTASLHPEDGDVRRWFVPVEEAHGVALDFSGHNHNYERTFPLRGSAPTEGGTTYVVTAGAGAPLYDNYGGEAYIAAGIVVNHYVVVRVTGNRLELDAYDLAGNVIDHAEITSPPAP